MSELGKMIRIEDLREIWKHEATDFSKWLANNLNLLSDAINVDITLIETESPVGPYKVDLYAEEELTGRKIVIENQLESTDHDHLGKIITYAAGKGADIIIWIVKRANGEHRQAIEWLNQHTDASKGFFLLEIELWKIEESKPAPKFNVVESPSGWEPSKNTLLQKGTNIPLYIEFWRAFEQYIKQNSAFTKSFPNWVAKFPKGFEHSQSFRINRDYRCELILRARVRDSQLLAGVFIYDNEPVFTKIKDKESEIISIFDLNAANSSGDDLVWVDNPKDRFAFIVRAADIQNSKSEWSNYFEWLCDRAVKWVNFILQNEIE